jgi:hypothetical protein
MFLIETLAVAALAAPTSYEADAERVWFKGALSSAIQKAQDEKKYIVIAFTADWSAQSQKLHEATFPDDHVVSELSAHICMNINTDSLKGQKLVEQYNVQTLPTLLVLTPEGVPEDVILGFIDPGGFVAEMARIKRGEKTLSAWRGQVEKDPKDLEARYALSQKLYDVGDTDAQEQQLTHIRKLDPKGKTVMGAKLALWDLMGECGPPCMVEGEEGEGEDKAGEVAEFDLSPLEKFLAKQKHDEVIYEGWTWIAGQENGRENPAAARTAYANAWPHVPEWNQIAYANDVAAWFFESREELEKKEAKFALELAEYAAANMESAGSCMNGGCGEECCGLDVDKFTAFQARYLDTLACCLYMNGKRSKAIEAIELAIQYDPNAAAYPERLVLFKERG